MGFVERQTLLGKRLMVKKGNVGGQVREFLVIRLLDPKEARKKAVSYTHLTLPTILLV